MDLLMEINHYLSYFVCLGKRGQDHAKGNGFMKPCIIQNISIIISFYGMQKM